MNNDVVILKLDRPRELRFGHKAFKMITAMTGKTLEEIEEMGFSDFELVEQLIYCGLLKDAKDNGETLKLEDMEDLLDCAPDYKHIVEAVRSAFLAAWGAAPEGTEGTEGNMGKSKENRSTGKKA